ncbi:MAG: HAD family hydrolase [Candidatus Micrarchaeia archaeon]
MLKFVFFDYDGTLLDSLHITYESFRRTFSELGYGEMSLEFFRREFSMNHKNMYLKMGVEEREVERVEKVWWEYWEKMRKEIKLFPQTVPTLEKLSLLGVGVGLVSDGRGSRIKEDLERFGIGKYFSVVVVREDVEERKPSPKSLLVALEKVRRRADECIYVGDRVEDVQAGRAAGMITGCVCNGTHKLEWLLKEEPDFVFSDVSGVVEIF